jgi:hypothetical protein
MARPAAVFLILTIALPAYAIRPFITDDARVVGRHRLQLESWVQVDGTATQHWVLPAFGPTDRIELTIGAVHGAAYEDADKTTYAAAGPLFQMKLLLHEPQPNRWPGVAVVGGVVTPYGYGGFAPPLLSGFTYVAVTESLGTNERVLIHANFGVHILSGLVEPHATITAGIGTQVHVVRGLHAVGEVAYSDPYGGPAGVAGQAGFRYIFNDSIQLDSTVGTGPWGEQQRPVWASMGIRIVSNPLW